MVCNASLAILAGMREGEPCVVGGVILGVNHQLTKRKESMARLTLEDLEGLSEILVWPSVLAKTALKLAKDELVVIKGRVDLSGDSAKVSAVYWWGWLTV